MRPSLDSQNVVRVKSKYKHGDIRLERVLLTTTVAANSVGRAPVRDKLRLMPKRA